MEKYQRDALNKKGIYVPIDFSNLKEVLPVDDEIIFSMLCKASINKSYSNETVQVSSYREWFTHVLGTNNGVAFMAPTFSVKRPYEIYEPISYRPTYKR